MSALRLRSTKVRIALLFFAGVLAFLVFLVRRHSRMVELYNSTLWGGTPEAHASLVELASFRGNGATDLLLNVASPSRRFFDDRQTLAVRLLAKRKDPQVAAKLAEYLKPNSALSLRTDVADSLLEMECDFPCARSVLHYLERMSCGELNLEEAFERDPDRRFSLKPEQDEVIAKLGKVLKNDQGATIEVLSKEYGLGSDFPSQFALRLVGTLELKSACYALARSSGSTYDDALRVQIDTLMQKLECQPSQPRPPR